MERGLLWSAFALGCLGWLCGLLLTQKQRKITSEKIEIARPFLLAAVVPPVLIFLITLPSTPSPPFAAGQGWGRGFLIGGVGALLAGWVVLRACGIVFGDNDPVRVAAVVATPYFLALVAVAGPLLWMRGTIIDALVGVAIGWFSVSFVLYEGLVMTRWPDAEAVRHSASPLHLTLVAGAGFAVTLCAAAALGVYRGFIVTDVARGIWSAVAVAFAAGIPFVFLLSALFTQLIGRATRRSASSSRRAVTFSPARSAIPAILLSLILMLALGNLLSLKVIEQPRLFYVIVVGLLSGMMVWWMARSTSGVNGADNVSPPPLAALVLLGAFMVSFQMLQGFGVGLMLLAAWLAAGLALPPALIGQRETQEETARQGVEETKATALVPLYGAALPCLPLLKVLLFGVILLLYRLFEMRFRADLRGVALTDHYAFFGFLVGAMLPASLATLLRRPSLAAPVSATPGSHVVWLMLAGALALAAPAIILLLWGAKSALALLAGLALAAVSGTWPITSERGLRFAAQDLALRTSLFALAIALALTQWTHRILPLAELSRAERVRVLAWIVVGLLVLLIVADYGGRLAAWMRQRRQERIGPTDEGAVR